MDKLMLAENGLLTNQEKELYRTLRTNVEFTGIENKVIAVTSCMPDDGKTTVSFQLASAFAENGKKTVYIDADLRKSVFSQRYNVKGNPKGISHYLSGQAPLTEVLYKTNKERFGQMLEEFKKIFDYIIIDTPPLGNVIDAAVIAKKCDASMLVLTSDKCSRGFAKGVVTQLKNANPNFLGVVLNKVDMKGKSYYGHTYKSYYGKGYHASGSGFDK